MSLKRKTGTNWYCKRFSVGASANSHFSMLGPENVKKIVVKITIYVSFVQKLFWFFFVKRIKFAQTGNLFFDGHHQLLLVSKICKMNLPLVPVKTVRIFSFNDSNNFNQSDSNISLGYFSLDIYIWSRDLVVNSFDWFTTKTYVDSSPNRKLVSTTEHILCKIQNLFLIWASFWLTVET